MYTNVNLAAPVGALAFLGTAFLVFVVGLALIYSIVKRKVGLMKFSLAAIALISGIYLVLLVIFSWASSEKVLARGEEKHFCEIDCHLAYSVTDVRETKTLGDAPNQLTAAGMFRVITIKTRFDENTISRNRGNGLLYPNSRVVTVSDENGNQYFPSPDAHALLEKSQAAGTAMSIPLRPSETYSTTVVFDLPTGVNSPTLLIREGELVTHLVIGHENSPLHKKTRFQI
jgi:predicted enzyme related to lactoylglutathione lyase